MASTNSDSYDERIRKLIEIYEKRRIVVQDADGNEEILPIGFRFQPSDEELVQHYLVPKAQNKRLPNRFVQDIADPFQDPRLLIPGEFENSKYFFSKESKNYQDNYPTGSRRSSWCLQKKKDKDIVAGQDDKEVIATRRCYKFFEQEDDSNRSELRFSGWKMHLYILPQALHREEDWVACHVYRQEDKYAAPPGGKSG